MATGKTISDKVADIVESKETLRQSIVGKGISLDEGAKLEAFPSAIDGIQIYSHSGDTIEIDRTSVVNLIIPDGISIIRDHAFFGCSKAKTVTIPASVTTIEEEALPWRSTSFIEGPYEVFIAKTVDEVKKMTPSYTLWGGKGEESVQVTIHCTDGDLMVQ